MEYVEHDNKGVPFGLTPKTRVVCKMSDGTEMWGEVEDIEWRHETDPVLSYRIVAWVPEGNVQ